jgi:ABC-type lipoprotein release transport system permease subunit
MLLSIAWRNLWRNKLRSTVIFTSIAVGIIGAVVSDGFMSGMTDQRVDAAIANEVSDIQIHNPAFLLNGEIQYQIPHAEKILNKIEAIPQVKGVSLRMRTSAMASSANAGAGITIYGVNPASERKVSDLYKHVIQGKYLSKKEKIPTIIGQKLAHKLNLGLGDKLIVTVTDSSGNITSGAFQIVGIYKTANDRFDEANVFVNKKNLSAIIGYPVTTGDEIAIRLKANSQTAGVIKILRRIFKNEISNKQIVVRSWDQIQPLLKSMISMMNYFSYIFLVIILAALAFAIINTMLMAVMERTREIGMLMALGMNKRKIFSLIMLETIFLSVVGAVLGLVISIFIINHYATYGFDLSSVAKGLNYIGYSSRIFFRVNTNFYITSIILIILIAVLSSISPALKALRLQPATAIRDVQ